MRQTSSSEPLTDEALRARYRTERDKRLRTDGNDQYVEVTGVFAEYVSDPHTPRIEREPLFDDVTVAFIGGGFAGLTCGAALKQAGIDNVRIIEKGGDFGGTWYWNRYPGAQCDTTSFVYMPLLEETGHMPTEKYAHAPEILAHCQRIGRHFDLYENACFSTEVTALTWDDAASRWTIETDRGDRMTAKYVAMGTGPLHRPKLPGIEGITTFERESFHTSRWDYTITGGSPAGDLMTKLGDKRVGIIGTGATSVQCVPHLARACGELFVFQRTPSSIDVRNNGPVDPEWFATLKSGWQQEWLSNFTTLQTGGFVEEDLVMDGWTDLSKRIRDRVVANADQHGIGPDAQLLAYEQSDDEKMSEIRRRVEEVVRDNETAEALKPWYRQLCKRPCFHDTYLQAYNEPAAHLIDTDGKGVQRIDQTGVWANDTHYELDLLIYASGFEVGTSYQRRSGFDATGRNGVTLSDYWADGMRSLHGLHVHGFPNLFVVSPSQGANLISNVPHNLSDHAQTLAAIISHAQAIGASQVEVTADAEAAWLDLLISGARRFGGNPDCTPGYYNNEGRTLDDNSFIGGYGYPDGAVAFFDYIEEWRSNGDFAGLAFT